jgi:nicotinate-nucleotide pyrophosphorylase (carboxylating)
MLTPLHPLQYDPLLRDALSEDLGTAGDLTTDAVVDPGATAHGTLVARAAGRVAGVGIAAAAFGVLDPGAAITVLVDDGADVDAGTTLPRWWRRPRAIARASSPHARPHRGCAHSNATRCAPAVAWTTASVSGTVS